MSDENWAPAVDENPNRFDLDAEAVDANELASRLHVDLPGKYHLEIAGAKNKFETTDDKGGLTYPHILIPCVVLQSVQGQSPAAAVHYHRVHVAGKGGGPMEDWQIKSTLCFLQGVGLLKNQGGKVIDPATGTTQIKLSTVAERLEHMQFIGDLRIEKSDNPQYKDRIAFSFGRGAFPIDAAEVRSVPKNLDALKLIGKESCMPPVASAPAPKGEGTGEKKGKAKKEPETPAPAPASTPTSPAASTAQAPAPTPAMSGPAAAAAENFDDL